MCRAWSVHTVPIARERVTTIATFRALTVRAGGGYVYRMCLIALAYQIHPRFPLTQAANRDEVGNGPLHRAVLARCTEFLAGRGRQAGGTWLGITRTGRFAAITKLRHLRRHSPLGPSRNRTEKQALLGTIDPQTTAAYGKAQPAWHTGPLHALRYHNNIEPADLPLAPGVHGISNAFLSTPWPKWNAKAGPARAAQKRPTHHRSALYAVPTNDALAADAQLPDTGLPLGWACRLVHLLPRCGLARAAPPCCWWM
ncbi:MAG: NRDE family protein, partial [Flavobacteriales bacterium]|nr:NRDE family protein [Flavobacteriales bacterium]